MALNKRALIRYKTIDACLRNRSHKWTLENLIDMDVQKMNFGLRLLVKRIKEAIRVAAAQYDLPGELAATLITRTL